MKKRNIVLDTNCLVQIISRRSPYRLVWDAFINEEFYLNVTTEILDEYHEVLSVVTNPIVANNILEIITNSPSTIFCNLYYKFNLINKDYDDNKFVDCAIAAQAEYIVSNDHHYDVLETISFPKVEVKTLQEFSRV